MSRELASGVYLYKRYRLHQGVLSSRQDLPFWGNICKELSKSTREQENSFHNAFEVLQVRFDMMSGLARFWNKDTLCYIMAYVVIIDNMIIEDEQNAYDPRAMITTKNPRWW